jgi:hypothetical protein
MKILGNFCQILIIELPFTPIQPRIDRSSPIHVVFVTLWPNISNELICDDELFEY